MVWGRTGLCRWYRVRSRKCDRRESPAAPFDNLFLRRLSRAPRNMFAADLARETRETEPLVDTSAERRDQRHFLRGGDTAPAGCRAGLVPCGAPAMQYHFVRACPGFPPAHFDCAARWRSEMKTCEWTACPGSSAFIDSRALSMRSCPVPLRMLLRGKRGRKLFHADLRLRRATTWATRTREFLFLVSLRFSLHIRLPSAASTLTLSPSSASFRAR